MRKKLGLILCLCGALTLAMACGDDDDKNGGTNQDSGGSVYLDTGVSGDFTVDGGTTIADSTVDTGVVTQDTGGGPATSNSGAICNAANPTCPDPANEMCVLLEQTATNGMCLGKCSSSGDVCPVVDTATMSSMCLAQVEVQPGQIQLVCLYICEVQGQTYKCPNDTDYKCEVADPSQPTVKICMPN